eukprot:NODE_419_length_1522_cov_95.820789_g387_i0.p1 GENE.NODE_419_length_1522_cov_95.820789_g387_i0~~NODE_419_length_1522_cov_95.820789_g387_i0.p1  ORF type:complete len:487 (+),score=53.85 NODE_419_length_1522_cov_95.820789_g387_i0:59-1519(+)
MLTRRLLHQLAAACRPLPVMAVTIPSVWPLLAHSRRWHTHLSSRLTHSEDLLKRAVQIKDTDSDFFSNKIVSDLLHSYNSLNLDEKRVFFGDLATKFGVDRARARTAATSFLKGFENPNQSDRVSQSSLRKLQKEITPLYSRLFSFVNQGANGTYELVQMRADLLKCIRQFPDDIYLKAVDHSLKQFLSTWFSRGFLDLEVITWDSPASLLEKVSNYESVHPIKSWNDLKHRVSGRGRRIYSFTHPTLRHEPVVFVEVALSDKIESNIHDVLWPETEADRTLSDTAIFYSINSPQQGLSGVDLGNMLIKRVVKHLKQELPELSNFCTLSPVPGFRSWMLSAIENWDERPHLAPKTEELELVTSSESFAQYLKSTLVDLGTENLNSLRSYLERQCLHYLLKEKKRGMAFNPVANFHVRNGAQVYRLNWMGNVSIKGMKGDCGFMVNYLYKLDQLDTNNQAYLEHGVIPVGDPVRQMMKSMGTSKNSQ